GCPIGGEMPDEWPIALRIGVKGKDPRAGHAQPIQEHAVPPDIRTNVERDSLRPQTYVIDQIACNARLMHAPPIDVTGNAIRRPSGEAKVERRAMPLDVAISTRESGNA